MWCTILAVGMQWTKDQRGTVAARTLQHLEDQLKEFKDKGQGDLRNARKFFNVIHKPLISIPIDHVRNLLTSHQQLQYAYPSYPSK